MIFPDTIVVLTADALLASFQPENRSRVRLGGTSSLIATVLQPQIQGRLCSNDQHHETEHQ
jgi:hypothetical protein